MNKDGNASSLVPFRPGEKRTIEAARKGGIAAGAARRRRADLRKKAREVLAMPLYFPEPWYDPDDPEAGLRDEDYILDRDTAQYAYDKGPVSIEDALPGGSSHKVTDVGNFRITEDKEGPFTKSYEAEVVILAQLTARAARGDIKAAELLFSIAYGSD